MIKIDIKNVDAIFLDFDGVLTDNYVYINEMGKESVRCSRSDGIAFDALRKLNIPYFIISSENNNVVRFRAKKLKSPVFYKIQNKLETLKKIIKENQFSKSRIVFVGNDINDYEVMKFCKYTICPHDSHPMIKKVSKIILKSNGGEGVMREIIENVFKVEIKNILEY